jgi:hypothetical protein
MRGPEFTTWKASVSRQLEAYLKAAKGVQRGFKEIQYIVPQMPKATDAPDIFISKTLDAMRDVQTNQQLTVETLSNSGYAVSQIKKNLTPIDPTGGQTASAPSAGGGWSPEKEARLQELLRKKSGGK